MSKKRYKNIKDKHKLFKKWNRIFDIIICIYLIWIICILPFYFTEGHTFIGSDKVNMFVFISKLFLPFVMIHFIIQMIYYIRNKGSLKDFINKLSLTDKFMLLFLAVILLSFLSSDYKSLAFWGANKWSLGLLTQVTFVCSYFCISRFWKKRFWILTLFLPVTAIVFALGFLNRFGIQPIHMAGANPQYISTIGNINWYCGYMVTIFFAGVYIAWSDIIKLKWQKMILYSYISIGFASLITQGSSSGILTLAVILFVMFLLSYQDSKKFLAFLKIFLTLSTVCLCICCIRIIFPDAITYNERLTDVLTLSILPFIMVLGVFFIYLYVLMKDKKGSYPAFFSSYIAKILIILLICVFGTYILLVIMNSLKPGSIGILSDIEIFKFTPDWGSKRGATWTAGIMCFLEQNIWQKIVGVGTDCMAGFLYGEGSAALNSLVTSAFGHLTLTNAHNEWITLLVNIGIGGLIGFIGITFSTIRRFCLKGRENININNVIAGACGLCVLSYTINNIFSFQTVLNGSLLFIVMGIGEAYHKSASENK